ncbi:MAG TPA: ATP-binding protein [Candidatus Acidoferrum sp.]|nr:ATP-binding protein [Candidatus Acidoferrum sp.]
MKFSWRMLLAGAMLLSAAQAGRSQSASYWRVYKVEDGLYQSGCASVSVAPNGKIVVLHLNRLFAGELDGYRVKSFGLPEPAGEISEGTGGQLWAMVPTGLLLEVRPTNWVARPVPEIAAGSNTVTPFFPVRWGQVVFLRPDELVEFRTETPERVQTRVLLRPEQTRLEKFTDMVAARDGGLWITGSRGLGRTPKLAGDTNLETAWRDFLPPPPAQIQNLRAPREDEDGGVTVIAESSVDGHKVAARFDGQDWTVYRPAAENLRLAWRSGDQVLWAASADTLYWQPSGQTNLVEYRDISARRYYDVAMEPGGTFWLATSSGLFHYSPPPWRNPPPLQPFNLPIQTLAEDTSGRLWFVAAGRLHSLQGDVHRDFALPENLAPNVPSLRALFLLRNGTLWLDAGTNSVCFNPDSGAFSPLPARDTVQRQKPLGLLPDGSLCVQSWSAAATNGGLAACDFERFEGEQFTPLADPPPPAAYATLFAARNGDLWLSGDTGLAWYHEKKWRQFPLSERTVPEAVLGFAELSDGHIWCATQDKLWEFDGRNWSTMRAGFEHINTLLGSRDGSVWVGDDAGVHRYFQKVWIENNSDDGLPDASVHEILEDQAGHIWVGTPHGLSRYHPEANPDPPRTFIQEPGDAELRVREGDTITIAFTGQDKWKFTPRERLLFSYKLDYRDWSPFLELHTISFSDLPAGRHVCQVRAMDRSGNIELKPASVEFTVMVPWYREIRLVAIAGTGAAVALFFAGLAVNRHRRLRRSHAEVEQKVAERTHELEIASRELLQSQKMTALGTLAAGIAHDFNNILSIIKGSAQLIEENPDNPDKVRTRVDRIKTVVDQGAGIVNAMLGFSGSAGEQPGPCDLNATARDTLKLLGDRFMREAEVKFTPAPDLPEIHASKNLIQQTLLNFIFNAAEAMTAHKQVLLATQKLERLPEDLALTPAPAPAYVAVSVRDTGCGIPPENLPRIFEPFFTTKALSTRRGTGLGLSMVYELAKKMGAGLAVESAVNRGSTFTLILAVQNPEKTQKAER